VSREAVNASFGQVTNSTSVNSTSGSSRIRMQNSYVLLKRRMMQQMNKRKHLNKSETGEQTKSEHILRDKRFRNKGQRVKHARKFYQRQRTSSTKLSIDLNDTLTKLKASNEINNNNNNQNISETNNNSQNTRDEMLTPNVTVSSSKNETSNLKSYKPSFKVEKLLNDSRGMKKYLIDYDCLMTSSKQQQYSSIGKVGKTFSLNNLSNLLVNESNFDSVDLDNENQCYMGAATTTTTASSFSSIQLNKLLDLNECDKSILDEIHHSFIKINKSAEVTTRHKAEITLENLSDCIMKKIKKIDRVNEENDEDGDHQDSNSNDENEEELEYDELLEKKSFSSISNKCSSGYLSDF